MTSVVVPVGPDGPLLDIEIGLPASLSQAVLAAGRPVPPPAVVTALIDTGADVTTVEPAVLTPFAAAGLVPTRYLFVNAPAVGGVAPVPEYEVGLSIGRLPGQPRSGWTVRKLPVVERAFGPGLAFRALVGRDVLDRLAFLYDGPGRRLTLLLGS